MTTLVNISLSIAFMLFSIGDVTAQWNKKKIDGNGNVTTETVTTSDYDGVRLVGSMDVHLSKGTEGTITVKTDSNIHEYLEIEVDGGILKISAKNGYSLNTRKGIHVYVPFKDLSEITLTGSGDIDSEDAIDGSKLSLKITGSGDISLDLNATDVESKITGSGDMTLKGKTANLKVTITGSGDFDGDDLASENTDASVSGSGNAMVNASKLLKARVYGSGDIEYGGNPEKRDTKVSGSGSISAN